MRESAGHNLAQLASIWRIHEATPGQEDRHQTKGAAPAAGAEKQSSCSPWAIVRGILRWNPGEGEGQLGRCWRFRIRGLGPQIRKRGGVWEK